MPTDPVSLQVPVARCFLPLLRPARYKGARGGRGAGKSYMAAERMVITCASAHHRVACLREYQSSMAESVKQLVEDKIRQHHLEALFSVTQTEIRGPFDSLIVFKGLQGNSAFALKSLEGFDLALVEEAQSISKISLETMTPTFRRTPTMTSDPEMWFVWNPIAEDDPVEVLFREHDENDPDFICVTVNYHDNPWFSADLRRDMERDRDRDPDKYAHVWLGQYQRLTQAAVFRNWRVEEFDEPLAGTTFYYGADWGFSIDPTVLVRCWLDGRTLYVDQEAYAVGCPIDATPELFDRVPGSRRWPIRADSARPETIDYMKRRGFNISPAEKGPGSVEDGVEFLKSCDIVVHPRCKHTIDELAKYSWKIDKKRQEVLPVLEDKANHVIDSLRYGLEGVRLIPQPFKISSIAIQRAAFSRPGAPAWRPGAIPIDALNDSDALNAHFARQNASQVAGSAPIISDAVLRRARLGRRRSY